MDIAAIVAFAQNHWDSILAIWGALVALATVIVKVTPTQADDAILAKVVKIADWLSVVNPKGTKVSKEPVSQADVKTEIVEAQK